MINPTRICKGDLPALSAHYDVVIMDDPTTFVWLTKTHLKYNFLVFLSHGLYSMEDDPNTVINLRGALNPDTPIICYSEAHRRAMQALGEFSNILVAGRALLWQHFMFSEERNGRIMTLGSGVLDRFKLYPDHDESVRVFEGAMRRFPDSLDVYGYNDGVPVQFRRGYNPYVMELRYYSVGFYPSGCPVVDNSLMETLAMGVAPVLRFPRLELPESGQGEFYFLEEDPNELLDKLEYLRRDEEMAVRMGRKAMEFAKKHFDAKPWGEKVRAFLGGLG